MTTGIRKTGDFCWINILTPRPPDAMDFFAQVLGWTYFEMPGIGHGMQVDGRNIGGIFDTDGPNSPPGMSPVIGVMVKVDNADAACERVAVAWRQGKASIRHRGPGPDGGLPRPLRRRV